MTSPADKALNEAFKKRVASEFVKARDRAKGDGKSIEEFVRNLGITRAALCKYVHGKAIPSLRVLRRARKYYGVNLSYGDLGDSYLKSKKKDPRQLELQFSMNEISRDQIEVKKFSSKGDSSVELLISIDFSKGA